MSILEHLKDVAPKHRSLGELSPQYQLTKSYRDEIREAKQLGYSWPQICGAVEKDAKGKGLWREEWNGNFWFVEKLYNRIVKEGAV
jgi:hypothetical protein